MEKIYCRCCGAIIRKPEKHSWCPKCGKSIKTKEQNKAEAEKLLPALKESEQYERIKEMVYDCKLAEPSREIRKIVPADIFVADEIIDMIWETRPSDWVIEQPPAPTPDNSLLTTCVACASEISKQAETCPHCGQPTGVHVCPRCQSMNTKVISGASKATSVVLWGPFAANKVVSKYECKSCGHKW